MLEAIIGAATVAVGILTIVQLALSNRAEKRHREAELQATRLQAEEDKAAEARQRDADMALWGGSVIDLMAELEVACYPLAEETAIRPSTFEHLGSRASALVDRGRLFFPNVQSGNGSGGDEGTRVEILDHVLRACYIGQHLAVHGNVAPKLMRQHIWQSRRRFVMLLQTEMRQSLRKVGKESEGVKIPLDPESWTKPTRPLRLPEKAEA